MFVMPRSEVEHLKWDGASGLKNISDDFYIVKNYIEKTGVQPEWHTQVVSIIKPKKSQITEITGLIPLSTFRYPPQLDGGWNGTKGIE